MLNTNFSPWPSFTEEEAEAIKNVLLSNKVNYWTGDQCRAFEKEFAEWSNTQYAIALANGTVALDLALHALEIGIGDEVIVTSRTFLASVSSIINIGATPIFSDVDLDSQNITAENIQRLITHKTKAIICVHLAGWPCDMDPIIALAKQHDLFVIEDCAQAHGAKYKGRPVGSIGHVGAWSFCQDKIMTTGGEGGMVTTDNELLWKKMWAFKDHGKSYDAIYHTEHAPGFRWLHESFGTNWRMTEIQGVIGRIQLKRMNDWHIKRLINANQIWDTAKQLAALRTPNIPEYIEHAAYKCYLFINSNQLKLGWSRDKIIEEINLLGVPCYSGSCSEVYLEKAFDNTNWRPEISLQNAQQLGQDSLMFLVHPTLTKLEIQKTCNALSNVIHLATLSK